MAERSHPSRVRELKPEDTLETLKELSSPPSRVRELKQLLSLVYLGLELVAPLPGA